MKPSGNQRNDRTYRLSSVPLTRRTAERIPKQPRSTILLYLVLCSLIALLDPLIFSSTTASAWSDNPKVNTPICTAGNDQWSPKLTSDGAGGAIITWEDWRSGTLDIYAQRINASGTIQWTTNGVPICTAGNAQRYPTLTSDGAGGAIITWEDWRSTADIYAQRIDASGAVKWTPNGEAITFFIHDQENPQITSDGSGGAIITWEDSRSGSHYDIYAQRINASGASHWTTNGEAICWAGNIQKNPQITSDGAGGAIITWVDYRSASSWDIYARRITASGFVQWAWNGEVISDASYHQYNPAIISDGSGGAIITWGDSRSGSHYDIYAQRINASGTIQWTANGKAICSASNDQYNPTITSDGAGGAIITWEDWRSGSNFDIYARRITASGAVQWTLNGKAICTASGSQYDPQIISDGAGGAIITWEDRRRGISNFDIYAQRINASGIVQWTLNGKAICTAGLNQDKPQITSDGAGGAIITWYDYRSSNYDIYAQRIYSNGTFPSAVANPLFSPPPGTYTTSQTVTLSCATPSATIYYTTDGSAPTQSSLLYSTPIAISETTTVKARAYKSSIAPSDTVTGLYTIVKPMPWISLLLDE